MVVKNKGNALRNPYAQEAMNLTVPRGTQFKKCYPILLRNLIVNRYQMGPVPCFWPVSEKAKELTSKPIWITGIGNCYDAHYPGDRDLSDCDSLQIAAQKAYEMAGITDPSQEIDLAEISEEFSYQELLWMEGLGLCKRGEAGRIDSRWHNEDRWPTACESIRWSFIGQPFGGGWYGSCCGGVSPVKWQSG